LSKLKFKAFKFGHKILKSHKTSIRHLALLEELRKSGSVSIAEIAIRLKVSEETIRRDAKILEQRDEALKLHGALALPNLVGEAPYEKRLRENADTKRAIAKLAASFVEDGDSIMMDGGTTTSLLSQELRSKRNLTIVTNSSDIARTLATVNGNKVFMAGGELEGDNGAAFGPTAVEFFSRFRVKHAFISISGITAEDGPMDGALAEAEIAYMALTRADHRVIISDSSKFGKTALVRVCAFTEINRIITDAQPNERLTAALAKAEIIVNIATT
jgi:DeoR family transcriptional regulator, glycerol-3-phosphate regulon repressor